MRARITAARMEQTVKKEDAMAAIKKDEELLAEVYRNTHYALVSISDILPETEDETLREELKHMHEGYELISGKAAHCAHERGIELKEPGPIKKAMMWSAIKMNAIKDDSRAHIAEMMTQGTVMGITALTRSIGDCKGCQDKEVLSIAEELLHLEENYENVLKNYL